jgi:folylpolyglutamate synthase/dihydropteroate synthase
MSSSSTDCERFQERTKLLLDVFNQLCNEKNEKKKKIKLVHVAGTNGKGSVCRYIAAGLASCGYTVALYTSPHLHVERERFSYLKAGTGAELCYLRESEWRNSIASVLSVNKSLHWFDVLTVAAFLHFVVGPLQLELDFDFAVVEVGIGGRYDSTTALVHGRSDLWSLSDAVVTSISRDHCAMLGDTRAEIAWQKLGIVRRHARAWTLSTQRADVLDVLLGDAQQDWRVVVPPSCEERDCFAQNRRLARAVLTGVVRYDEARVDTTFARTQWPCRLEVFAVSDSLELVLDGAHNIDAIERVYERLGAVVDIAVFGCSAGKEAGAMLRRAVEHSKRVVIARGIADAVGSSHAMMRAERLAALADRLPSSVSVAEQCTLDDQLRALANRAADDERLVVLITGSLYIAKLARQWLANHYPQLFDKHDPVFLHQSGN